MSKIQGIVITPDNQVTIKSFSNNNIEELQKAIGCQCFSVCETDHASFFIDDEGKLKDSKLNHIATLLWWTFMGQPVDDYLVGNVIVFAPATENGETLSATPLSIAWAQKIKRLYEE